MAKHRNPGLTPGAKAAIAVGVVVLLGGAGGAYALTRGDASPGTAQTSSTSTSSTTSSPSDTPTPSETSTPPVDPLAAPFTACKSEVTAGQAVAVAAAASARDWGAHAKAGADLAAGKITQAQAKKIWAASKAPGPADLAAFAAAEPVYKKAVGGCTSVTTAAAAAGVAVPADAAACVARSKVLATVATTGAKVNAQWAAHQAQMKTKATANPTSYFNEWMAFVTTSKPVLAAYGAAAATLAKAPACA